MSVRIALALQMLLFVISAMPAHAVVLDNFASHPAGGALNSTDDWSAHNLNVTSAQAIECGDTSFLGTAWYLPADKKWVQTKLTISCYVDLKGSVLTQNTGACFRSGSILFLRGNSFIIARVYMLREYDESTDTYKLKQYLEIIIKESSAAPLSEKRPIDSLAFTGTLELEVEAGGEVKVTFGGSSFSHPNNINDATDVTHVGIQIRRPANGLPSPTVDDFESSEPLENIL